MRLSDQPKDRPTNQPLGCFFFPVCSSASEDLGCRRGDFSRKHYGSVELVSPRPICRREKGGEGGGGADES